MSTSQTRASAIRALVAAALFAALCRPQTSPGAEPLPPAYEPKADYQRRTIEGWPVYVSRRLNDDPAHHALRDRVLELLRVKLYDVARVVPAGPLEKLRRVPVWVELKDKRFPCMCYHPSAEWLRANGYNPEKAGGVEIANAENFLKWTIDQPWMVLHELAHAYHHLVLGHGHADLRKAFEAAKKSGTYDSILHINGRRQRAYALNNDQEYFAECTEAFFGTNDFFPFVRSELQQHDPGMFALLGKVWESRPD